MLAAVATVVDQHAPPESGEARASAAAHGERAELITELEGALAAARAQQGLLRESLAAVIGLLERPAG